MCRCLGDLAPAASQLQDTSAKWFCHRCQNNYDRTFLDSFLEAHPAVAADKGEGEERQEGEKKEDDALRHLCRDFLQCIMSHDLATEFCQPIDGTAHVLLRDMLVGL